MRLQKNERHFRSVPEWFARKHWEAIFEGFEANRKSKRLPSPVDREPYLFFAGERYCLEDYEHVRGRLANSKAWSIGWAIASEEFRDCSAPAHTLAELFMTEQLA